MLTPNQVELSPTPATILDESRGVVTFDMIPQIDVDPYGRNNTAMLAGQIGLALAGQEAPAREIKRDPALQVSRPDYERAYPYLLKKGLIYPYGSLPFSDQSTRPHLVVYVTEGQPTLSRKDAPGVVGQYDGVAVNNSEYDGFVRSATGLADKVESWTLKKHANNQNREERDERVSLHVTEAIEGRLHVLSELDESLVAQLAVLRRVYRDSRLVWRTAYLTKNLDRDRRLADEIIHDVIEVAATNLEYSTAQTNAVHRAAFSNRYHRGSSRELAQAWRIHTGVFGQYKNAIRGKVSQSRNACELEIRRKMTPPTLKVA